MDDASLGAGIPKFEFVKQGLGRGPVTVTVPDGELLQGDYQITENASLGVALAGTHMATAVASGGGRPFVANAVGPRGTILNCEGVLDLGGHGSVLCQTNRGTRYRVMI